MAQKRDPSVSPIDLQTILGDALKLSPSTVQEPQKGALAKGVSEESSVTATETNNTQAYWPQQYIWYPERHSQERGAHFTKTPLLKTPILSVPELLALPIGLKNWN